MQKVELVHTWCENIILPHLSRRFEPDARPWPELRRGNFQGQAKEVRHASRSLAIPVKRFEFWEFKYQIAGRARKNRFKAENKMTEEAGFHSY